MTSSYSMPAASPAGMTEEEARKAQALQPRLIKGMQAEYVPAFWPGHNSSGLNPYGPNVLVCMDSCSEASSGGILLLDDVRDRMDEASVTGCVFAIGPDAFRLMENRPSVGERIYIDKYAGIKARGVDGKFYRIVDEKCIACGITDPEE